MDRSVAIAKKSAKKEMSIEEALWASADKMRGSVEYPVYKQVVLCLVFLKFVNERFEKRRAEIVSEGKEDRIEMPFAYMMKNVWIGKKKWTRRDSNSRLLPCEGSDLPG